jgi:2-oxoglutarate dehydrogenase E1 component
MTADAHGRHALSLGFIEALWERWREEPAAVPQEWARYFAGQGSGSAPVDPVGARLAVGREQLAGDGRPGGGCRDECGRAIAAAELQHRVGELIRNHRIRGHRVARVDPLTEEVPVIPELDPAYYGIAGAELGALVAAGTLAGGGMLEVGEVLRRLRATYCGAIGVQFMHIGDLRVREWLQRRMERTLNRIDLPGAVQRRILERLTDAVLFEGFVQRKFTGAKSFSLEGAESLIPLLDLAVEKAGGQGVEEVVLAMPHRGRLNVLANILGKPPAAIFREFEDADASQNIGRGDVKYHQGYHRDWITAAGGRLHLALTFNPSHLEFVCPVAMGRMRAKQDRSGDADRRRGLLVLVHGDAAFAGQGVVQETLNLSRLEGYTVGGALHIVVNNQIGFTTPPEQARSTIYATDVARMLQIPIFHVNGENPEAVAQVVDLALDFRLEFARDAVIDMLCYRRRGHNETDEPAFTQPLMARAIEGLEPVRERYLRHLSGLGQLAREEADAVAEASRGRLERQFEDLRQGRPPVEPRAASGSELARIWSGYRGGPDREVPEVATGVPVERLARILDGLTRLPEGFTPHPKIERLLERRRAMARGEAPLDWAAAEALAFATLAEEGLRVRLSGQDSERGTFSHRHAVLHDARTGERYRPLSHVAAGQAPVEIINSPLSEAGVLGFEVGYAVACPDGLTLWEAQFGDFANAAQVIIDQFVASAEDKWKSLSGLTLLLPHGLEGTGPEHASARLERFLQLAAEDNLQVAQPTTPASFFHLLRRQVLRPWRKPLIVMSPKSMLRHPEAVSPLADLAEGGFRRILPDEDPSPAGIRRVLLTSGKLYWELRSRRERDRREDVAILRLEQLYPLDPEDLEAVLAAYPDGTEVVWVQEEPWNSGAWPHLALRHAAAVRRRWPLEEICRAESASPATGSAASHRVEQQEIIDRAFDGP